MRKKRHRIVYEEIDIVSENERLHKSLSGLKSL